MHSLPRPKRARAVSLATAALVLFALSFFPATVAAEGETVYIERLVGTYVGITIVFPDGIDGSFAGTVNGKHFDCEVIPPDALYCIGPLAYWSTPATLHIYSQGDGEILFSQVISVPPKSGEPEGGPPPEPDSEECPPEECDIQVQ